MKCPFQSNPLRPGLPPLTERIAKLPVDPDRGYPIPFFVTMIDGKPEFRLADSEKYVRCIKQSLCWVCGEPMGNYKAFVIVPMCSINRISADPPTHLDCAEWSVKGCPFLTKPSMVRRQDELTDSMKENVAGVMIERNPGVMAVWVTKSFKLVRDHGKGVLFSIGEPESISWWREGRTATRAEILESIDTGLPELKKYAETSEERHALNVAHIRAMELLPA